MVVERRNPPRDWRDPKKYKPYLRRNFAYTCAYSWVHERPLGGEATFEVEHMRPEGRKEFAHLRCVYVNLYYVWGPCNRAKGKSWPSAEEEAQGFRFIDPCAESAFEHLAYELDHGRFTGRLFGCTPAGRYTIIKCALNNDVLRDVRRKQAADFVKERKRLQRLETILNCESVVEENRRAIEALCADARDKMMEILKPMPLPPDC